MGFTSFANSSAYVSMSLILIGSETSERNLDISIAISLGSLLLQIAKTFETCQKAAYGKVKKARG